MLSLRKIAMLSRACWCRRCINMKYGLELMPYDCIYQHFPAVCPQCGEVRNIVADLPLKSRLLVYFKMRDIKKNKKQDHSLP